ncbi:DUF5652 family protein [Leifsonia sp. C5G2]|uniref:DUF5652 family protein n=1 Tax=Leifsonia sp. C5G2 TaxID=2735269 RepID=UPI00201CA009|nr:DUF5652 family protein [Leifsonia sp. C5G2]
MKAKTQSMGTMSWRDMPPGGKVVIGAVVVWSLAWKGASLWRAARNGSKPWFVTLLLSNTLGALDAIYLFAVDRPHRSEHRVEEAILAATGEPEQLAHSDET